MITERDPVWDEWSTAWPERWGTADTVTLERLAPSLADDDAYRRWWAHYERQSMSPGAWARTHGDQRGNRRASPSGWYSTSQRSSCIAATTY